MENKFYQLKIKTWEEIKTNPNVEIRKDALNNEMLYCVGQKDVFTTQMEKCVSIDSDRLVDVELLRKNTYYEADTGVIYYPWMIDSIIKEIPIMSQEEFDIT